MTRIAIRQLRAFEPMLTPGALQIAYGALYDPMGWVEAGLSSVATPNYSWGGIGGLARLEVSGQAFVRYGWSEASPPGAGEIGAGCGLYPYHPPHLVYGVGSVPAAIFRVSRPCLKGNQVATAWLGVTLGATIIYQEAHVVFENGLLVSGDVTNLDPAAVNLSVQAYQLDFEDGELVSSSRVALATPEAMIVMPDGSLRLSFNVTDIVRGLLDAPNPTTSEIYFMPAGPFSVEPGDDVYGFLSQWVSSCTGNLDEDGNLENMEFVGRRLAFGSCNLGPLQIELDFDQLEADVSPVFVGAAPAFTEP